MQIFEPSKRNFKILSWNPNEDKKLTLFADRIATRGELFGISPMRPIYSREFDILDVHYICPTANS